MAKPNVHTASRDELRDAGVRADVIDEIVKRRRRKGGITLASLDEVQGVGPATLEQLGKALDFTEPPGEEAEADGEPQPPQQGRPANGDRRGGSDDRAAAKVPEPAEQATDAAEATLRAGTEQAADLVAATVQGGAEATRPRGRDGTTCGWRWWSGQPRRPRARRVKRCSARPKTRRRSGRRSSSSSRSRAGRTWRP